MNDQTLPRKLQSLWHSNMLKRNGPEETKKTSIAVAENQPIREEELRLFPVTWLDERCVMKVKGFYSVAEELLPPGDEQNYIHTQLSAVYTNTDPLWSETFQSNPLLCLLWILIRYVTVFTLEAEFLFPTIYFFSSVDFLLPVISAWGCGRYSLLWMLRKGTDLLQQRR